MKKLLAAYNIKWSVENWVWFLIWFTLPISIRLNSIAIFIGSMALLIIFLRKPHPIQKRKLYYLSVPIILFFVYAFSVYNNFFELIVLKEIEQLLSLLVFPLLFMISSSDKESFKQVSLSALVLSLSLAGILMIGDSAWWYFKTGSISVFTYHSLSLPFETGAIYMSFFILVTLLQINEIHWLALAGKVKYIIISFLVLILFLLASKLLIILGVVMLILKYHSYIKYSLQRRKILIPLLIILALMMVIPLGLRLKKLSNPNLNIVLADSYKYDSPLNGLNLRLIQLRFGVEILVDNDAWLGGVGVDESQETLNNMYIKYGLYTGYEGSDDTGYLEYNFHNQFMETFVRVGIVGVLLLFLMFVLMLSVPQNTRFVSDWVIVIIFMFFLTESVIERQVGIVYFCLVYSSYFPSNSLNES